MIPVYKPWLTSLEKKYLNEAIDSGWISSTGKFIEKAEKLFADFIGVKHCVLASSGTTALHLCIRSLNLPEGSSIIVPNITFVATAFAAAYDKHNIIFTDVDPETWNIDIGEVAFQCQYEKNNGRHVSAVIPVHLYGNPCDMVKLLELQHEYGFRIIEDACESLGASIDDWFTGAIGDVGCFSFYGNKSFSSGEGGALVTNDDWIADRARLLRGQAQDPQKRYWHIDIGYNYRITNMQAAILCGQLERADEILREKERVADLYYLNLAGTNLQFQKVLPGHHHSNWLFSVMLPSKYDPWMGLVHEVTNEEFSDYMRKHDIDTRKVFYPITHMPPFQSESRFTNSERLSLYGLSLPSYPELTNQEVDHICQVIKSHPAII